MSYKSKEESREYQKRYYQLNKEKVSQRGKQNYEKLKNDPERYNKRLENIREKGTNRLCYYNRKQQQIELLGGQCVKCHTTENLEINHRNLADTALRRQSNKKISQKPTTEELKEGLVDVELLCKECHKDWSAAQKKAAFELLASLPVEEQIRLTQKHSSKG